MALSETGPEERDWVILSWSSPYGGLIQLKSEGWAGALQPKLSWWVGAERLVFKVHIHSKKFCPLVEAFP